jgi:hypothetical protein
MELYSTFLQMDLPKIIKQAGLNNIEKDRYDSCVIQFSDGEMTFFNTFLKSLLK